MKKLSALLLAAIMLLASCGAILAEGGADILFTDSFAQAQRTFTPLSYSPAATTNATPADLSRLDNFDPREGYTIAPTMFGETGIDILSSFIIRTATDNAPAISIDGQPTPSIIRQEANIFVITPAVPLTHNALYTLRLARDGMPSVTWAFQTARLFQVASTLPHHQATNVPVETGIEFNFSIEGRTTIEDSFSIYPQVEGRFTQRGATTVFMPLDPLEEGTVYTVTLSAGVELVGTNEATTTETLFQFETTSGATSETNWNNASVHFLTNYIEFPSFEAPVVSFWLNQPHAQRTRPAIEVSVYELADTAAGVAAVNRLANTFHWAHASRENNFVNTNGLNRMLRFTINERQESPHSSWNEAIELPRNLPPGFYVLEAVTDGNRSQVVIQISDLAVQVISDNARTLLWINDMTTGQPAAGATVLDVRNNTTITATDYGIAILNRSLSSDMNEHLLVTAADGKQLSVITTPFSIRRLNSWDWNWSSSRIMWDDWAPWPRTFNANDNYWAVLQLDRTLFQRDDTVHLWGFVQDRRGIENINHVTVELTQGWGWGWWGMPEPDVLFRANLPVTNGSYHGEIRLPNLEPSSYNLSVIVNGVTVSSTFFTVNDYVKPPYQLVTSADKAAMFAWETVNFTARAEFFEGTPVPDLRVNYSIWSSATGRNGGGTTDNDGRFEASAGPFNFAPHHSGEQWLEFTAEATLPEIGWVHRRQPVRVFVNDIHVRASASHVRGDANLNINIHDITLDRLNSGTNATHNDFLASPVSGQTIDVTIREHYWVRIREGERYDWITRQVVPRYRSEPRVRNTQSFTLTTDADGFAERNFTIPFEENPTDWRSYSAQITTTDGNGRRIVREVFIGRDFESFHRMTDDGRPFLYGARPSGEGYDIGEAITLTVKQGMEPLNQGNFLFVVAQDNVLSYHIGSNQLTLTFEEKHVPNAQVFAFHFNGHTYHSDGNMGTRLHFNTTERELNIEIETNQDEYRPGDTATITVRVTDKNGNPRVGNVNIALVDEALFALMDYEVATLNMLYGRVSDSLRLTMATHSTFISDGVDDGQMYGIQMQRMAGAASAVPEAVASADMAPAAESEAWGGGDTLIRERFEDTAHFASARTNAQGIATFTIPLPHNITAWRLTASAITEDLYAGHSVAHVRVTNPMFVHYTLNRVFLVGDTPTIGVNAFGTALTGGEQVTFEIWRESNPADIRTESNPTDIRTATGVAFERVNIPLWPMETEGSGAIVVRAMVGSHTDTMRHSYMVVNSHRLVETTNFYTVEAGTTFNLPTTGVTNITFTDHGRGQFLNDLFSLTNIWRNGRRIEGFVAQREALRLMAEHFPDVDTWVALADFDVLDYQQPSGGIAMLPHGSADLRTTVMLLPFILDEINLPTMRSYLREAYLGGTENRMLALYGLAILGEPVLHDLQRYAELDQLSVRDAAYLTLSFVVFGEGDAALQVYNRFIIPHIQALAPYYRIQQPGLSRQQILDQTAIVALAAAGLGLPQAIGLFNYATRDWVVNPLLQLERLAFINSEINNFSDATASITYRLHGETITRELGRWFDFNLRLPISNMADFEIISTTGQVGAVSVVRVPLEDIEIIENGITVTRTFFRAGTNTAATTFEQDELVRVQISINYPAQAVTGSYLITDFLPAGLALVQGSARFGNADTTPGRLQWATAEGQRVTFFDHNGRFSRGHVYYYYARVINPGTFTAEGTLVQSLGAREYMAVGDSATITIR